LLLAARAQGGFAGEDKVRDATNSCNLNAAQ
jgi:hypothetical protein